MNTHTYYFHPNTGTTVTIAYRDRVDSDDCSNRGFAMVQPVPTSFFCGFPMMNLTNIYTALQSFHPVGNER